MGGIKSWKMPEFLKFVLCLNKKRREKNLWGFWENNEKSNNPWRNLLRKSLLFSLFSSSLTHTTNKRNKILNFQKRNVNMRMWWKWQERKPGKWPGFLDLCFRKTEAAGGVGGCGNFERRGIKELIGRKCPKKFLHSDMDGLFIENPGVFFHLRLTT